jgi:SMODS-associating 2TM, beta-strand rich effector domain
MMNLSGEWTLSGVTLGPDGAELYAWSADVTITHANDQISLVTETIGERTSRSLSYAEKLIRKPTGELVLRYCYELDPEHPVAKTWNFYGMTELAFAEDGNSAVGSSCNKNPDRYVVARLSLERS